MIENKFLHFETYNEFKNQLNNNNVDPGSIAFVDDESIIWTHGKEFGGNSGTDKQYDPESFSGLGRVHLKKNIVEDKNVLTQDMINTENTIYYVEYDYDLDGQTINIPQGCVIMFSGGTLSNGTLTCNDTLFVSNLYYDYFNTVSLTGDYRDETIKSLQEQIYSIISGDAVVKLTATPSVVFVNDTQNITLTATTNETASSIIISKGDTIIGEGSGKSFTAIDNNVKSTVSGAISYTADYTINGLHRNATANIHAVDKIYYGVGTVDDYADITDYQSARTSAAGSYPFTTTEQKPYVYILQPYNMTAINLSHIYLGKFGYNMELISDNITRDNVRYRVYRSVSDNQPTSFILTID